MSLSDSIILNCYSAVITVIILVYYIKNGDKGEKHTSLFMRMLWLVLFLLVVDTMGRFDGHPDTYYAVFNQLGNLMLFLLAPALPSLWLLYLHYYIFPDRTPGKAMGGFLIGVNLLNLGLVAANQFTGWLYAIDDGNIYARGPVYPLIPAMTLVLLLTSTGYVIRLRKKVERTHFVPFLLFPAAPLIGTVLQTVIYGVPFVLAGLVFSILMVAFFGQSIETNVDYLSGAYNRKRLEYYLRKKIAASSRVSTFSAIMADVNGLKLVNDTHGHTVGDEVLVTIATLIRSILRSNDFVARYGGDEFCIILDTSSEETLRTVVDKINRQLANYNDMSLKPYRLGLSMGYAVYDPDSGMSAKEFYNLIDGMMYEDKKRHHAKHK
jgi:diguanylate cyclase (GGDEF)-like protein